MGKMVMRKLLDLNTASIPVDLSKDLSPLKTHEGSFDPNLVVILAALLCALISALAINYIIRWAFHCGHLISGRYRRRRRSAVEEEADGTRAAAPPLVNNKGLKRATVQTLPTITYAKPGDADLDCPICLADFADGEKVRVLPKCNHSFHRQCIDKWLLDHSSCPTCRQNLVDVPAEKKTVAALLCRYQHSHSCVDSSSIRIIFHHATDNQPQHSAAQPQPYPILIPPRETQEESVENPEQESRV